MTASDRNTDSDNSQRHIHRNPYKNLQCIHPSRLRESLCPTGRREKRNSIPSRVRSPGMQSYNLHREPARKPLPGNSSGRHQSRSILISSCGLPQNLQVLRTVRPKSADLCNFHPHHIPVRVRRRDPTEADCRNLRGKSQSSNS